VKLRCKYLLCLLIIIGVLVFLSCNNNPTDSSPTSNQLSLVEGLPKNTFYTITRVGDVLYVNCGFKLYSSSDNGNTWTSIGKDLPDSTTINEFSGINNYLAAASKGYGVYLSSNFGKSWYEPGNKGLNIYANYVNSVLMTSEFLFMASGNNIYRSSDYGENWIPVNNGLPTDADSLLLPYLNINFLAKGNNLLFAFPKFHGVYYSENNGDSWTPMNDGFNSYDDQTIWWPSNFAVSNSYYFIIKGESIYRRSFSKISSWTKLPISPVPQFVVASENIVVIYTDSRIEISSDNGDSWKTVTENFGQNSILQAVIHNNYLFITSSYNGVWKLKIK